MKYFVISDVHGFYDEMMTALNKTGFDKDDVSHTLICLGDVFDRGSKPKEVMTYLNSLKRKILIKGNHEEMMEEMLKTKYPEYVNEINGSTKTARIITGEDDIAKAIDKLNGDATWIEYKNNLVDYFETKDYVFVHGWIPCYYNRITRQYFYMNDWREAKVYDWSDARWANGFDCTIQKIFEPNKKIVCGHRGSKYWHEYFNDKLDYSPYYSENMIAIDGTTITSHVVNCIIIEN